MPFSVLSPAEGQQMDVTQTSPQPPRTILHFSVEVNEQLGGRSPSASSQGALPASCAPSCMCTSCSPTWQSKSAVSYSGTADPGAPSPRAALRLSASTPASARASPTKTPLFAAAPPQPIAAPSPLVTTSITLAGPMGGGGRGRAQVRRRVLLAERLGAACGQERSCQMRASFNTSDQSGSESHGDRSV